MTPATRAFFWSYGTHGDFCRKLEDAEAMPVQSPDPILRFTRANSRGRSIRWEHRYAIADRMDQLTADWPQFDWLTTGADHI